MFGSLLALLLASPVVWVAPASARILSDRECLELNPSDDWDGHWIFDFGGPNDASFAAGSPTIEGDLSSGLVLTWKFDDLKSSEDLTFLVEFFDDSGCLDNYVDPPEGVCVTFSATGWTPSADDSSAYDYYYNETAEDVFDGYTFEGLGVELGTEFEFDLSKVIEDETIGDETATAQSYNFYWSDGATTGDGVTLSATLGLCGSGGGDGGGGDDGSGDNGDDGGGNGDAEPDRGSGFDIDFDIDHLRNRAAAQAGSLPDTL